jgi:hypothetical protein
MYYSKSVYKIQYTIFIERGLIIVACQHIFSGCSFKIGSSMILERNHNVRRDVIMLDSTKFQFRITILHNITITSKRQ